MSIIKDEEALYENSREHICFPMYEFMYLYLCIHALLKMYLEMYSSRVSEDGRSRRDWNAGLWPLPRVN